MREPAYSAKLVSKVEIFHLVGDCQRDICVVDSSDPGMLKSVLSRVSLSDVEPCKLEKKVLSQA